MSNQGYKSLIVYKKSYAANISEAYRKRLYPKHFISKLSDSDGECAETMMHWDFTKDCGYLKEEKHKLITEEYLQIGKMLGSMMSSPKKFSVSKLPTVPAN